MAYKLPQKKKTLQIYVLEIKINCKTYKKKKEQKPENNLIICLDTNLSVTLVISLKKPLRYIK